MLGPLRQVPILRSALLTRLDARHQFLERRLRRKDERTRLTHGREQAHLPIVILPALCAAGQVGAHGRRRFLGERLVGQPRQQPGEFLVCMHCCLILIHRSTPLYFGPASVASSNFNFRRPWNMRVFTVFTGQFMIWAISSQECPTW